MVDSGGGEYVFGGGVADFTTVSSGGYEFVSSASVASDTIMLPGGILDITYLPFVSSGSTSANTSGVLTVTEGTKATHSNWRAVTRTTFVFTRDPHGGTLVTAEAAPCFRAGTRILTEHGEIAVENLLVGDLVRTGPDGAAAPIIWIGRREVDCARHTRPNRVWPVRVAAHAFGPGRPRTDLFLSPDHAVYLNDVLIPIRELIDGRSIARVPVDRVVY